jgi:hypothetical protein
MAESSQVLKKLDFPAYCIKLLDNGLIAIAGGGGTSKTGVGNSIELGLIDYQYSESESKASVDASLSGGGIARFKSIHTFVPNDAIMKFVGFTSERTNKPAENRNSSSHSKLKREKSESTSSNKISDLFLAAPVNNTIEIYKLVPTANKSAQEAVVAKKTIANGSVKKRKGSRTKSNSLSSDQSQTSGSQGSSEPLEASAYLKLSNVVKMNEYDESLSDPFEDAAVGNRASVSSSSKGRLNSVNSKSAQNLCQVNQSDESISSLAVCKVRNTTCKNNNKTTGLSVLLCAGTSKGTL